MTGRYATVSANLAGHGTSDEREDRSVDRTSYTEALGCSDTIVDVYRCPAGRTVTLPVEPEQACLPIDASRPVSVDGDRIPTPGVGYVPPETERSLQCDTPTVVAVVGATTDSPATGDTVTVGLDECEFTTPSTSSVETARLTARLGCRGMKINARRLDPGDHVPYHTEGDQEELFVPVRGPATMRIDETTVETPVGTLARVAPPVPRSAVNGGDAEALWVMIGAPPTGGPGEWDPGATILE